MKALKSRWPLALVPFLLLLSLSGRAPAADTVSPPPSADTEAVGEGEAEFDEIEALKKKAATEGDWQQSKDEQIAVNQRVFTKPWNKPPFDNKVFDYTPEQMKEQWPVLMRMLKVPFPSPEYLKARIEKYPSFKPANFDGDYEKLSRECVEIWRLFFRGDYQEAMQKSAKLGPAGMIPGKLGQMMYAIYLEPSLEDKHMLLQDTANVVRDYGSSLDKMKKDKDAQDDYVVIRIGYSYAIGRIAEDVPIPVAIGRNYVFKVLDAANDVLDVDPNNALGLAFRAGIDANIVRKVGKATGRVTFGAKQTNVKEYFDRALKQIPDAAIIRYEYANAMLYMDKKRQIDESMAQLKQSAGTRPHFSMEALDAMYAAKRLKEVEALSKWPGSFRSFERKRLKYQKDNNMNLYCVLPGRCPAFIIQ